MCFRVPSQPKPFPDSTFSIGSIWCCCKGWQKEHLRVINSNQGAVLSGCSDCIPNHSIPELTGSMAPLQQFQPHSAQQPAPAGIRDVKQLLVHTHSCGFPNPVTTKPGTGSGSCHSPQQEGKIKSLKKERCPPGILSQEVTKSITLPYPGAAG